MARLVNGGLASLHELQTIYSLSDAYYLSEILDIKEEQIYLRNKENG